MTTRYRARRRTTIRRPRRNATSAYRPRRYLLSHNEAAFFRVLLALVGHRYQISCKVRLADIVTCSDRDWNRGHGNRIALKHLDFVLSCPATSRIVAAIELDDSSHQSLERSERDMFLNRLFSQMQLPLLRVPATWHYDIEHVRALLSTSGITCKSDR